MQKRLFLREETLFCIRLAFVSGWLLHQAGSCRRAVCARRAWVLPRGCARLFAHRRKHAGREAASAPAPGQGRRCGNQEARTGKRPPCARTRPALWQSRGAHRQVPLCPGKAEPPPSRGTAAAVFPFKRGAQRPLARTASNSSSISLDGGAVSSETTTMHRLENRNAGSSS